MDRAQIVCVLSPMFPNATTLIDFSRSCFAVWCVCDEKQNDFWIFYTSINWLLTQCNSNTRPIAPHFSFDVLLLTLNSVSLWNIPKKIDRHANLSYSSPSFSLSDCYFTKRQLLMRHHEKYSWKIQSNNIWPIQLFFVVNSTSTTWMAWHSCALTAFPTHFEMIHLHTPHFTVCKWFWPNSSFKVHTIWSTIDRYSAAFRRARMNVWRHFNDGFDPEIIKVFRLMVSVHFWKGIRCIESIMNIHRFWTKRWSFCVGFGVLKEKERFFFNWNSS